MKTHLCPPCDPGTNGMAFVVIEDALAKLLNKDRPFRTRAYEAHLTPDDIDELRQLIEPKLPKPSPCACDSRIVFRKPIGLLPTLRHPLASTEI